MQVSETEGEKRPALMYHHFFAESLSFPLVNRRRSRSADWRVDESLRC